MKTVFEEYGVLLYDLVVGSMVILGLQMVLEWVMR